MLYKVFDFADKEAHDVMVPRPEVVALSVELPPQEALAAVIDSPYTRYPVYRDSLDDVLGDPARPRPLPRAVRPRNRQRRHRAHRPPGVRRAGDQGPRLAPRRVPAPEPAPGARRGRVRLGAGDRDARGPAGGDRRRDRGRVRPSGRVDRADSRTTASASTAPSRSTTSTSASAPSCRRRTTTRSPGSCSGCSGAPRSRATRWTADGLLFRVVEVDGPRIERLEVEFKAPLAEEEPSPEAASGGK